MDFYLEHLRQAATSGPVKDWVKEFLEAKRNDNLSKRHPSDLKSRLGKFSGYHADNHVCDISPSAIEDWLNQLNLKAQSKKNYRTVHFAFFAYCERRNACGINPVAKTPRVKVRLVDRVAIFKPGEFKTMLLLASGDIRTYLLFGGFAGIRKAEIRRLR